MFFNWNFYPFEVVSRWRNSQLQVSENEIKLRSTIFEILLIDVMF